MRNSRPRASLGARPPSASDRTPGYESASGNREELFGDRLARLSLRAKRLPRRGFAADAQLPHAQTGLAGAGRATPRLPSPPGSEPGSPTRPSDGARSKPQVFPFLPAWKFGTFKTRGARKRGIFVSSYKKIGALDQAQIGTCGPRALCESPFLVRELNAVR